MGETFIQGSRDLVPELVILVPDSANTQMLRFPLKLPPHS